MGISFDDQEICIEQCLRKCAANTEEYDFEGSVICQTQWFFHGYNLQATASLRLHVQFAKKNRGIHIEDRENHANSP